MKLNDLAYFVAVVERRGFAAAAEVMQVPKSSVSKRIAALEKDLGVRLIQRTTRRFQVTEAGDDVYRHAAAALLEAEAARDAVQRRLAEPRGLVRVSAAMTTVQMALAELVPIFADRHPKVQIALTATNRFVDLVHDGFDVAVRAHRAPLASSDYLQRRLGFSPNHLVASPGYLARKGMPEAPGALEQHDAILADISQATSIWTLEAADGDKVEVGGTPRIFADDPGTLLNAALSGLGIANLPRGMCWPAIRDGRLVPVLPDWRSGGVTISLLSPHRRGQLPSVRAVIDFLADGLGERLALQ